MKKICVFVGSRANYSSIKSVMKNIDLHPDLELMTVVGASALLDRYGKVSNLIKSDLLINCTPLGSNLRKNYLNKTPINDRIFKYIDKNSTIFDIVYSPKITKLNKQSKKYGVNYLNGLLMNTAQAKRALKIVFKN